MGKRCGICNNINPAQSIYCRKCGAFLKLSEISGIKHSPVKTIWEIDRNRNGQGLKKTGISKPPEKKDHFLVCPMCENNELVTDGRMPLFCSACGYIYQAGDRPVSEEKLQDVINAKQTRPVDKSADRILQKRRRYGPMKRAGEDRSALYLFEIMSGAASRMCVDPTGMVLCEQNGIKLYSASARFVHSPGGQYARVFHSAAGWYIETINDRVIFNGIQLAAGSARRVFDGDFIDVSNHTFRIEIREETVASPSRASAMRWISMSKEKPFVKSIYPIGHIIWEKGRVGESCTRKGNLVKPIIQIWYSDNGWHFRALKEQILLNGEEMNTGVSVAVKNGDLLNYGNYAVSVEITGDE